jgi:hypothetical protein
MIQTRKRSDPPPRPITLTAAEDLGAFDLAELWADRMAWPVDKRTLYDELAELAVMSALARWLQRWQPIAIHSAMLAGARPDAVAAALGDSVDAAYQHWHQWATRQRNVIVGARPGVTEDEFNVVAERFADIGR